MKLNKLGRNKRIIDILDNSILNFERTGEFDLEYLASDIYDFMYIQKNANHEETKQELKEMFKTGEGSEYIHAGTFVYDTLANAIARMLIKRIDKLNE